MQVDRLGPYRIVQQIGRGGMGAVFEAVFADADAAIPRGSLPARVAIKVLSPQLALAEGFRERFEAEIESLKKLNHPGIVRLYGYGEQEGMLFYSMELVAGTSLEEEISAGRRFDWRETLGLGIQICQALKHAHDHGVVHRDIKPANLLLVPENQIVDPSGANPPQLPSGGDGSCAPSAGDQLACRAGLIKIADFGIARLFGGSQLTMAGGVLGTADYMSPEQADGRTVTARCDQYSLGGVLYALLTGRHPFRARSVNEMLQMQRFAKPEPVGRYAPQTPPELAEVIAQLLAKQPEDRFPNVQVLGRHLEAMAQALDRQPPEPPAIVVKQADTVPDVQKPPDAPTLAVTSQQSPDTAADSGREFAAAPTWQQSPPTPPPDAPPAEMPPSHFTTVEEEHQRESPRESRLALAAQLTALLLSLAVLIGGGMYLMQPATADALYAEITAKIDQDGSQGLGEVAAVLAQFLQRFPDDPRAAELEGYRQQLDLQQFERNIRRQAWGRDDPSLAPLQRIYLQAMSQAEDNPGAAAQQLRALLTLFDPLEQTQGEHSPEFTNEQRLLVVARRQVEKLAARAQQEAEQQLPVLRERLAAAAALESSQPARARAMYQALNQFYGPRPWAAELVAQAREALAY